MGGTLLLLAVLAIGLQDKGWCHLSRRQSSGYCSNCDVGEGEGEV